MKIGFVLDDGLDRGDGVQQYILTLGNWLTGQGHQVHYLVGETKRTDIPHVHSLSRNLAVRFNGNRMTMPLPAKTAKIRQLLEAERFDVLHLQMPYSPFMAAKVIRLAPAGTRLVGTFHIMPYGWLQTVGAQLLSWWLRRTTARLQLVWSVSEPARQFALTLGIKSAVLPNVVDTSRFKNRVAKDSRHFTVVFLGRLVRRKGCQELLEAFARLAQQLPTARLVIGGQGPLDGQLKAWVNQHGLADKVAFAGFIKEADKPAFLAQADVAVFPSLAGESFGIVLLEAMAAGAGVVVGGNNPGYSSVLAPMPEVLADPRQTELLARLLQQLQTDRQLAGRLHKQQQKLVQQYDVAVVGKKLVSYYKG